MRFRSPIVSERKALTEMVHSGLNWLWGAFANRSRRDYSRMLEDPTSSSLIMAVVLWIVRRWPEAPIYLEDRKGDAVRDHAMLSLLNRPNPYYSGAALWFGVILSLVWDGNGYIVKIKNQRTLAVEQLWYVPHFLIQPKINTNSQSYVDYYEYTPGGSEEVRLSPEDVVHIRYGIDPYNPRCGMSPLKSIARDAVADEEADNFAASLLLNMGVPGLIISPDLSDGQSVAPSDMDAAKKFLKEKFGGDKRGEPLVMAGPTKVQQFGFDPKSMDLSTLRGIPEERVSAVTGVPAAVVGFGSGLAQTKVGATMRELREMAYEDAIIPLQRLVGPELESQLLSEFEPRPEEWAIKFDLSQVRVLQDDQDALYKRTIEAFNGGLISRAQGKQALGFETTPADEIRRVPFSVTEVPEGSMVEPPTPPSPTKSRRRIESKGIGSRERAFATMQLREADRQISAYRPRLEAGFDRIGQRCADAYLYLVEHGQIKSRMVERKEEGDAQPQDEISISIDAHNILMQAAQAGGLSEELAWMAHYLSVTTATLANINAVFGVAFDQPDPIMRATVAAGGKHIALVDVDGQTRNGIFKALAEGRANGDGPPALARSIRSMVGGRAMFPGIYQAKHDYWFAHGKSEDEAARLGDQAARQYRSEVIARTETKYAQNVSTIEAGKGSGTFDAMLVFDAQLGTTDAECEALNGQTVSFEEAQALAESEHPNGTRSFTPVISGGA